MNNMRFYRTLLPLLALLLVATLPPGVGAAVLVQCPAEADADGDGIPRQNLFGTEVDSGDGAALNPKVKCMHLTAGDGWVRTADGRDDVYIFSFSDVTGIPPAQVLTKGIFRANSPAPTIRVREGDELYLTLTNVGLHQRPDLFDPHSVHYHGFPNSSAIFDGLPESAITINQQASITYYYNNVHPGTYLWHCHVEATEHMQMGMLGNLYVEPIQNQTGIGGTLQAPNNATKARKEDGPATAPLGYVYNDGDGSTAFDKEYVIQLQAFDDVFHDASRDVQPLPFAEMKDTYPTINGRGYPDTVVAGPLVPPPPDSCVGDTDNCEQLSPQLVSSLITATQGQRVLLRMTNLSVVQNYSVSVLGIPMRVIGQGAKQLRGPAGLDVSYQSNVVNLASGESVDVILNTAGLASGTYFLYSTNLNYLSNNQQDNGGFMTEIVIN